MDNVELRDALAENEARRRQIGKLERQVERLQIENQRLRAEGAADERPADPLPEVERDEVGYVLRIATHSPFHPWWKITQELAEALNGYANRPRIISTVGTFTPKYGMGSLENPRTIGLGQADVAITNPPITAWLAMKAKGPYKESVGSLRAIARFPEPDYIFWLVSEEFGVSTFEELVERRPPLTLVSGRIGPGGPDPLTFLVEEVMKAYGFSYADVEAWGGKVLFPGSSRVGGIPIMRRGEANAIFQEGVHDPLWEELAETKPLRSLGLSRRVVDHIKQNLGFDEAIIPKGRLKGIEEDQLTLDFGGWLLFSREDLPDELAYLLAKVADQKRERIAAPYKDLPPHQRSIEVPITREHLCAKCVIPLHPGAETYYREIGCLQ